MVFYFTGTGNSLYIAKQIEENPISIPQVMRQDHLEFTADSIGIAVPVYGHEVPSMVKEFLKKAVFHTDYFYILSILLAVTMSLSMAACGQNSDNESAAADTQEQSTSTAQSDQATDEAGSNTETNAEDTPENGAAEGKTLVVYYSATGNTEAVVNYIADATGGDLFELQPADPYTDEDLSYSNENSRVLQEYEDESLRDVELISTTVEGFDEYENIFVGYPIWWQIAAWPVNQFIENNDFTGKTVIPFCTSASSEIGDSGKLLEEMAGTGNWLEGERFRSIASEEDVAAWVDSLGL